MGRANGLYQTRWEEQNQLRRAQPCRPFATYVFKYDSARENNMAIVRIYTKANLEVCRLERLVEVCKLVASLRFDAFWRSFE